VPEGFPREKTRKIACLMESEKVHLPMIKKCRRFKGFAPPLWHPGWDSAVLLNP
jgi:hypothetical protein